MYVELAVWHQQMFVFLLSIFVFRGAGDRKILP